MGYDTNFTGKFDLNKPLAQEHRAYLAAFADTRRMRRDSAKAEKCPDPVRVTAGLTIGPEGSYFVGGQGMSGQDRDTSILDYNSPPKGQPGLWCQWAPSPDGAFVEWDGGEKFYNYVEWLEYLTDHFLKPWGYTLSGEVKWDGEDPNDRGIIRVRNGIISVGQGRIEYDFSE